MRSRTRSFHPILADATKEAIPSDGLSPSPTLTRREPETARRRIVPASSRKAFRNLETSFVRINVLPVDVLPVTGPDVAFRERDWTFPRLTP